MREARLTAYAKAMRKEPSEPEQRLWLALRAKRFENVKFRRQKVIGRYIADFAARDPMLVIELDGDTHAGQEGYDEARTHFLQEQGYRVIRFSNIDVMTNLEGVLLTIASVIATSPLPTSDGSAMLPAWPKQRGALFTRRSPEGERAKR